MYPKLMLVSEDNKEWIKAIVINRRNAKFLSWLSLGGIIQTKEYPYAKSLDNDSCKRLELKDIEYLRNIILNKNNEK